MTVRLARHWKLAVWWLLSLVVVGAVSSSAQQTRPNQRPGFNLITETPIVISGNDVGFRVERTQDGIPVGKVVVRVNGVWVDTATPTPTTGR
jgi:hypothetical protein